MEQANGNTKTRKWQQLTEAERYKIEGYIEEGIIISKIARLLNRSRRTIERDIGQYPHIWTHAVELTYPVILPLSRLKGLLR